MDCFQAFLLGFTLVLVSSLELSQAQASSEYSIQANLQAGLKFGLHVLHEDHLTTEWREDGDRTFRRSLHRTLKSLSSLYEYQNSSNGSLRSHVLEAVLSDSCAWLQSVLGSGFHCTKEDIDYLVFRIDLYTALDRGAIDLKDMIPDFNTNYVRNTVWVEQAIPCDGGDGTKARKYLSERGYSNVLRPIASCSQ